MVLEKSIMEFTRKKLRIGDVLSNLCRRAAITDAPPALCARPKRALSIRAAVLSPCEVIDVCDCEGRVAAATEQMARINDAWDTICKVRGM